jgi:hypothetical protein
VNQVVAAVAASIGAFEAKAQLVTALELELIGPTQRVLRALGAEGEGLETEALDRLPSSWYPTGFLVPTETDLALKCDDTADDDFAAADGVDLRKPKKANTAYKFRNGNRADAVWQHFDRRIHRQPPALVPIEQPLPEIAGSVSR